MPPLADTLSQTNSASGPGEVACREPPVAHAPGSPVVFPMKTCANCQTENAADNRFCQQCGRPLDTVAPAPVPADATVLWQGKPVPGQVSPRQQIPIAALFGSKD